MTYRNHKLFSLFLLSVFVLPLLITYVGFAQVAPVITPTGRIGGSVVGGVAIDANGLLNTAPPQLQQQLARQLQQELQAVPKDLDAAAPLRRISLKKLDQILTKCKESKVQIPDEVKYLGGLLRIEYVVAVPEENDIILVGPAEGWAVNNFGAVVGKKTGQPILMLEDFLTILRSWQGAAPEPILCSIDPTQEALVRVQQVQNARLDMSPGEYIAALERAYGLNVVTVKGIPADSRVANVLVAADYRMKRIGLGQEPAPIAKFPSYIDMIPNRGTVQSSRFWLAPKSTDITHDEEKLVWNLSGVKVQTLTEVDMLGRHPSGRQVSGVRDIPAERWCEMMTNRYDELARASSVFADLRNCMDIAVVVAVIQRENLFKRVDFKTTSLTNVTLLPLPTYNVPKQVRSEATTSTRYTSVVVACGGVEINPMESVAAAKYNAKLNSERSKFTVTGDSWFAN